MKLRPEFSEALVQSRFLDSSQDPFNRREMIERIANLNENVDQGFTAILDARWGAGKTTFAKAVKEELNFRSVPCIYFNAFENDYSSSAFECLASTFFEYAKATKVKGGERYRDFLRATGNVFKVVGFAGAKVFAKAATLGVLDGSEIDGIKEIVSDGAGELTEKSEDAIEKILEARADSEKSFAAFRHSVKRIADWHKESNCKGNLLVIVDELDRCRPDFALDILEVIKHLFSVNNVNFILVTNFDAMVAAISHRYGLGEKANDYLEKFYDFRIFFGIEEGQEYDIAVGRFINQVLSDLIDQKSFVDDIESYVKYISIGFDLTLREVEKFCLAIALVYASRSSRENIDIFLLCYCILLKFKFPDSYIRLKNGTLSYAEISTVINHSHLKTDYLQENFKKWMQYYFDPNIEYSSPEWNQFISPSMWGGRLKVFKNYANRVVDRFSR